MKIIGPERGSDCDSCGKDNRQLALMGRPYRECWVCYRCANEAARTLGGSEEIAFRIADWIDANATTPEPGRRVVDAIGLLAVLQQATGVDWSKLISGRRDVSQRTPETE